MEHPEEHEDPEVLEYEITTFVYRRRQPFDLDKTPTSLWLAGQRISSVSRVVSGFHKTSR